MTDIVTGDDIAIPVTLKKDDATFLINTGVAVIQAAVISKNKKTTVIASTSVPESNAGSDWINSLIVVEFSSTQTGAITRYGEALLEIQVDDGGKTTWFASVNIVQGTIA